MALPKANFRFSTTLFQPTDDIAQTLYPNAVPSNVPTVLLLDPKTTQEEKVKVTSKTSSSITVIRGYGGTTAKSHNLGAVIVDYNNPEFINELVDAFEAEHGDDGSHDSDDVVTPDGAQTLTDKEMDGEENTFTNLPADELKIAGEAEGDILMRGASGWERLPIGDPDQELRVNGDGDALEYHTPSNTQAPSFRAHRNSVNQTPINNNVYTKVQFTHESFDSNNNYDNATNFRFQPTVPGKYRVNLQILVDVTVTNTLHNAAIFKNGVIHSADQKVTDGTFSQTVNVSDVIELNGSSDYIEGFYWQNTGGAVQISGNPAFTFFSAN